MERKAEGVSDWMWGSRKQQRRLKSIARLLLSCLPNATIQPSLTPDNRFGVCILFHFKMYSLSCQYILIRLPRQPYKATTNERPGIGAVPGPLTVWPSTSGISISWELVSRTESLFSPRLCGLRTCNATRYSGDLYAC